jgi:hypothetical protein
LDRPCLNGKMDQSIFSTGQKAFLETFHFTRPPQAERLPAGLPPGEENQVPHGGR